jgi:hypothetical protein
MVLNAKEIHQRARRTAAVQGFFRYETLIVLGIAVLLFGLCVFNIFWMPNTWWIWLLLGAGGAAALVYTNTRNKVVIRSFVNEKLDAQIVVNNIGVPELQSNVAKAMYQHRAISKMLVERPEDLDDVLEVLDDWVILVHDIARNLDETLRNATLIQQSRTALGESDQVELIHDPISAVISAATHVARENKSHPLVLARDVILKARNELSIALDQVITVNTALRRARAMRMESQHVAQIQSVIEVQVLALTEVQDAVQHLSYAYSKA